MKNIKVIRWVVARTGTEAWDRATVDLHHVTIGRTKDEAFALADQFNQNDPDDCDPPCVWRPWKVTVELEEQR